MNPALESARSKIRKIKLLGKQALFARSKARYPAMFGGYASGKTTVGCLVGLDLCLKHPGIVGAVIRNSYPELRTSTKKVFMDLVEAIDYGRSEPNKIVLSSNEQYNWVKFKNGSIVFFLHTQSEALYKGPEFGWFFIDQAEELEEETARKITTRLRQPGYPQKGMFAGNTDKGHNWCYRWFKLKQKANAELFEISFLDNIQNLDQGYVEEMMTYPDEWKKINLFGSWDAPGGLVIEPTELHMIDPFEPPSSWPRYIAMDPAEGTGTTAALGFTIGPRGDFVFLKEYYGKRKLIREHAANIKNIWHGMERLIIADPNSWRKHQALESGFITIADRYRKHGVIAVPAVNDVLGSLDILRELHEPDPDHSHLITGKKPAPWIYFAKDSLPNTFEEMRSWMTDNPSKEPVHAMDCLRYGVSSGLSHRRRRYFFKPGRNRVLSYLGA